MITLYSSSMNMELNRLTVGSDFLRSQMVWGVFGLAGCAAAAAVDYRRWKKLAPWILGFSVILLILVYVPHVGWAAKGAHRWIALPLLPHFQPSELAKLAVIIFLAAYAEHYQRQMGTLKYGLAVPIAILAIPLALIFKEPDRGCTILLALVTVTMFIVAGVRFLYLAPAGFLAAAGLALSFLHDPMRLTRIKAWLHPELYKDGAGYQAYQAMIAFGSGGWTGLGLGEGRQKLGFVLERHTDFIFAIIGEELGLVATLAVVALFATLLFCGIFIARRAADTFGRLLATGITFMISFQACINMGVTTNLLPCKGMPLPFISYGGSNLLLMLVCVGLLCSISRFSAEPALATSDPFDVPQKLSDE